KWQVQPATTAHSDGQFIFPDLNGQPVEANVPWKSIRQVIRWGTTNFLVTGDNLFAIVNRKPLSLGWTGRVNQVAISPIGVPYIAATGGLFQQRQQGLHRVEPVDEGGRAGAFKGVLGVAFESKGQLWFATRAGVGCQTAEGWKFYEGKDGLPWNDFTCVTAGSEGEVWFGTRLGAIRFDGNNWQYRQGRRW